MANELYHYGIKGMKWGVRRTPEQLGHRNLKKAKTKNLNRWGKDKNHNVLYITGYSGSGKTTVAKSIADKNTDIIHLDSYFDDVTDRTSRQKNKTFNKLLKKNGVKIPVITNKSWDGFERSIKEFGREQYLNGRKVIAEGIQIADSGLFQNKNFYKTQPIIILQSGAIRSLTQRLKRDNDRVSISNAKDYVDWYLQMNSQLRTLESVTNASRGEEWVQNYFSTGNKK